MKSISLQIHSHLLSAKKVIIVPHQNPDGDALGSAVALSEYLQALKKTTAIFCVTPIAPRLNFLLHGHQIHTSSNIFLDSNVDTVVVLDSGDLRYAGVDKHLYKHPATIINIDHHATNEHYGWHNLVMPTASSTAEVLYHFFTHTDTKITSRMATALLAGLITDTGNFTNSATTPTALKITSELLRYGGNLSLVNNRTGKNKTLNILRLWGTILSRLENHEPSGITHTYLTQSDYTDFGVNEDEVEGISNFLNNLDNTKIVLFLKDNGAGIVKASFRTTQDGVDVSLIAKKFGGGGHKKAAGFTTNGTIAEVLNKILQN